MTRHPLAPLYPDGRVPLPVAMRFETDPRGTWRRVARTLVDGFPVRWRLAHGALDSLGRREFLREHARLCGLHPLRFEQQEREGLERGDLPF